jgi:hypothetical protein
VTTASYTSTAEYDAFGPWIDEVTTADDVPPLYRSRPIDFATGTLVLKFPRNIARRDATPAMHLYDHLMIVDERGLTILSRDGDRFTELAIGYDQIAAINDWVNLLDAQLTVFTLAGDAVIVPYNGSSNDTVVALIDLLRQRAGQTGRTRDLPPEHPPLELDDLGKKDALFVTGFRDLKRREPAIRLLAAHGRVVVRRRGGVLSSIADAVLPITLHGALVAATPTELQVLSRREWFTRGGVPVLSRGRTVVSLDELRAVTVAEHPRYIGVSVVTLQVGSTRVPIDVPEGSPAQKALRALR